MKSPIVISVTVPVHNTAPYLPRCLDSILAQTYPHLEIICVDDGSTDNSLEILNKYAVIDSRIRVYHQEAQGVAAARNTALFHSCGDFVTSVDSDDFIHPQTYEKAIKFISDDVDIVSYGIQLLDTSNTPIPDLDAYYAIPFKGIYSLTPKMTEHMNVCIWSRLWRKSIIDQYNIQYPVGLVHEDDAMFYMYTPFVRKAAFLPDICYYYVQRNGSIMHNDRKSLADAEQCLGIIRYVFSFHQRSGLNPLQNDYILRQFSRAYHQVERFCPKQHRRKLADMFLTLARETGLATAYSRDWRIRCLYQPPRWLSPFIQRRSRNTQYRFGPVPLWSLLYAPDADSLRWRFDLWRALRGLLQHFSVCRKRTS